MLNNLKNIMSFMPFADLSTLKDEERIFAGFILNKLWILRYWCGTGKRQHLGHTSKKNLPKGRPGSDAGEINSVAKKLKKAGFINFFPANGKIHVCASRADEIITKVLLL